jgi:hypothetical protein
MLHLVKVIEDKECRRYLGQNDLCKIVGGHFRLTWLYIEHSPAF